MRKSEVKGGEQILSLSPTFFLSTLHVYYSYGFQMSWGVERCVPLLSTVGVRIYSSLEKNNALYLTMSTDYALCCVCRICRSLPLLECRRFQFITLRINVYHSPMLQDFPYISPPKGHNLCVPIDTYHVFLLYSESAKSPSFKGTRSC